MAGLAFLLCIPSLTTCSAWTRTPLFCSPPAYCGRSSTGLGAKKSGERLAVWVLCRFGCGGGVRRRPAKQRHPSLKVSSGPSFDSAVVMDHDSLVFVFTAQKPLRSLKGNLAHHNGALAVLDELKLFGPDQKGHWTRHGLGQCDALAEECDF